MHIDIRAKSRKELGNSSFIGGKIERKLNFFEMAEYVLNKVTFCVEQSPLISVTAIKTRPSVGIVGVELRVQLPIGSDSILSSC